MIIIRRECDYKVFKSYQLRYGILIDMTSKSVLFNTNQLR